VTLPKPPLTYLITSGIVTAENFSEKKSEVLAIVRTAVENRLSMVQLREKRLPAGLLLELTSGAAGIAKNSSTRILVNDRADIAIAAGADGVHLPSNSISPLVVRRTFPGLLIGVSTHTLEETEAAAAEGADFACFGPVFDTPGKGPSQGVEKFAEVCGRVSPLPVIALGGVNAGNYQQILAAGGSGFAAIRFLNGPENMKMVSGRPGR
jgi:thiamine-phosphate pyrophosphorylase